MNRHIQHIVLFLVALLLSVNSFALKKAELKAPTLSVEQEQQFKYYFYAAKDAIEHERYADAYALLEFCRMLNPNDGQVLAFLGVLYEGIGAKETAYMLYEQAYEADPVGQSERYNEIQKTKRMYDAYNEFKTYVYEGKTRKALSTIDNYLKTDPKNVSFMLMRVDLLEQMNAKPKTLYNAYEQVLSVDPGHLYVLNNYAYLLATNKGDLNKAEQMSLYTINEDPFNAVYLDTYGWILHMQGKDDLARFYLTRAATNCKGESCIVIQEHLNEIKK